MLIVPLLPDLRLGHKPIATFVIIGLCFAVHYFQDRSHAAVANAAQTYCSTVYTSENGGAADLPAGFSKHCEYWMTLTHQFGD
jgi:hypothetical protein